MRFGQYPSLTDGLFLRTWRGGSHKGEPKLPPAVQSLLARGLVGLRSERIGPRAMFTEAGLAALRQLAQDHRALDPIRYALCVACTYKADRYQLPIDQPWHSTCISWHLVSGLASVPFPSVACMPHRAAASAARHNFVVSEVDEVAEAYLLVRLRTQARGNRANDKAGCGSTNLPGQRPTM